LAVISRHHPVGIGFFQELLDGSRIFGSLEQLAERVVPKLPRDALERPEVVAGTVGRRYEQEKELNGLAIKALEVDPLLAHGHGPDESGHARVLRVRHGHTPADPGAPKIFSLEDGLDDALFIGSGDLAGIDERTNHLADDALFRVSVDMGANRVRRDKIGELHAGKRPG
jgi:hypothetical protein